MYYNRDIINLHRNLHANDSLSSLIFDRLKCLPSNFMIPLNLLKNN